MSFYATNPFFFWCELSNPSLLRRISRMKKYKKNKNPKLNAAQTGAKKMEESSGDAAIETLRSRGWCFGDLEQVKAMILIHSALADDTRTVVNSVESELTNMDLKSVCAKSLPDPITLRKSSHLLGPKVLQANIPSSFA